MIGTVDQRKWTEVHRMQEFFRLKAKEGDAGFAIAYALTLVAHSHAKEAVLAAAPMSGRMGRSLS